jgi:hypothetical protein
VNEPLFSLASLSLLLSFNRPSLSIAVTAIAATQE